MQPSKQNFSTSRRTLEVDDYIDIIRRHRAWILGPLFAGLVISVVVAFLWPDTYVSTARLRVTPQQVPEKYVQSNILEMSSRVEQMKQMVGSRPVLINIIRTHNLYPRQLKSMPMEDVVEEMRRDISIGSLSADRSRAPTFQISFTYENRLTAQKVCSELVSQFINENIRARSTQSQATTEFLKDQYDSAKKQLDETEAKIAQFRASNQGRLPEQLQANLQQLSAFEARMTGLQNAQSRISQEKMILESRLRSAKEQANALSAPQPVADQQRASAKVNEKVAGFNKEIERAELSLSALRERYTPKHPEVQQMEQALKWLKSQRDDAIKQDKIAQDAAAKELAKNPTPAPTRVVNPLLVKELRDAQAVVEQAELIIRSKDVDFERTTAEIKDLERQMKVLQARIEASPMNEPAYQQLLRDRDSARDKYAEMNKKKGQSETATVIEDRKQGETLDQLEPPSTPQTPSYPKRWLIVTFGSVIGLTVGIFLAGAREVKDTSLKNLKDVRAYTQLTVLGSIPLLENDLVVRRRRRVAWLAWSTALLLGVTVALGSVYYYYTVTRS